MNIIKSTAAAFIATILVSATAAHATAITTESYQFNDNDRMLVAMNGPASATYGTGADAAQVIDGNVNIDFSNVTFWADGFYDTNTLAPVGTGQRGLSSRDEMSEAIDSWTLSLSHGGVTEVLSPVATGNELFGQNSLSFVSTLFDGVVASGDWFLTASSDYWRTDKRKIQFDLAATFDVANSATGSSGGSSSGGSSSSSSSGGSSSSSSGGSSSGGQVPAPAPLTLIGAMALFGAWRRKRSIAA